MVPDTLGSPDPLGRGDSGAPPHHLSLKEAFVATHHRHASEISAQKELCDDCLRDVNAAPCPHAYKEGGCTHPELHGAVGNTPADRVQRFLDGYIGGAALMQAHGEVLLVADLKALVQAYRHMISPALDEAGHPDLMP